MYAKNTNMCVLLFSQLFLYCFIKCVVHLVVHMNYPPRNAMQVYTVLKEGQSSDMEMHKGLGCSMHIELCHMTGLHTAIWHSCIYMRMAKQGE